MECYTECLAIPLQEFSFVLNSSYVCHWGPNLSYRLAGIKINSTYVRFTNFALRFINVGALSEVCVCVCECVCVCLC
jgi:hypothetical protein